jgi:NAD(P)-dependent dehydrogenase (short-subunit alcohol dehydrogenase family)
MSKNAVITGTSRGLGLLLAHHFLNAGWKVWGLCRTPESQILSSPDYTHVPLDISDKSAVINFFASQTTTFDLIINNAAVFKMASIDETDFDTIDRIIDTNVKGAMYVTKAGAQKMNVGGRIIFINSVAGLEEIDMQSVYCASKHALTAFAGVIGKEMRGRGVKVTSIHPGGMNTPLWNDSNPYPASGLKSLALDTREIARVIDHVMSAPDNTEYKTIKLFPMVEWH